MFKGTERLDDLYNKHGDVMHVEHWYGNIGKVYAELEGYEYNIIRKVNSVAKEIHINKLWKRPNWYLPALRILKRKYHRLSMEENITSALITCSNHRFPNNFHPQTVHDVELYAREYSNRDWRIELIEAFESALYQRQGRNKWVLVELGKGFA